MKYDVSVSLEIDVPDDIGADALEEYIWTEVRPREDYNFVVTGYRACDTITKAAK